MPNIIKFGGGTKNVTQSYTPSTSNQTIAKGYHNGTGVVYGDADLVAGNIKNGINIFGVTGTVTIPSLVTSSSWQSYYSRSGTSSNSFTMTVNSKVLAIVASGLENVTALLIRINFQDGTVIDASSSNGTYAVGGGYYDSTRTWFNINPTYHSKIVSSVYVQITASYSVLACDILKFS